MRLYKYTFGDWEKYGPANDDKDAYERRISVDPQFHYVPVMIEEVIIEGYTINAEPNTHNPELSSAEIIEKLDKDGLKTFLNAKQVKFFNGADEEKLRELAMSHVSI